MSYEYGDDDDDDNNYNQSFFDGDNQDNDDSSQQETLDCDWEYPCDECHDYDGDGYCDHDLNKDGWCPHDDICEIDMGDTPETDDYLHQLPTHYGAAFYNSKRMRGYNYQGGEMVTEDVLRQIEILYEEFLNNPEEEEEEYTPKEGEEREETAQTPEEEAQLTDSSDYIAQRGLKKDDTENDSLWVLEYNESLARIGAANGNAWQRDTTLDAHGEPPVGLKGSFANGVKVHYTKRDKVSVTTAEHVAPAADHFKEVITLAKEHGQEIRLGTDMTSEFRNALIKACAEAGVGMQNLTSKDKELYDSLKPREDIRAAEVKDTDEKGNPLYKLSPRMAEAWSVMYRAKAQSVTFPDEIKKVEQQLAAGAYKVTGEEKVRAQLLMMKYVQAMKNQEEKKAKDCVTALQRYGVDTIVRDPETKKDKVTGKAYDERTEKEKADIDRAMKKMLPEKAQKYDPALLRQLMEKKNHTLQ